MVSNSIKSTKNLGGFQFVQKWRGFEWVEMMPGKWRLIDFERKRVFNRFSNAGILTCYKLRIEYFYMS